MIYKLYDITYMYQLGHGDAVLSCTLLCSAQSMLNTGQSISSIGRVPIEIVVKKKGKASHYVGFDCVSFLGRISNGTP